MECVLCTIDVEDGSTQVLLCLYGTVQIRFRGAQYNIPVTLWIPRAYPEQSPICFVTPTATMSIKTGKFVDPSGRIFHPQLAYWQAEVGGDTLAHLHDMAILLF